MSIKSIELQEILKLGQALQEANKLMEAQRLLGQPGAAVREANRMLKAQRWLGQPGAALQEANKLMEAQRLTGKTINIARNFEESRKAWKQILPIWEALREIGPIDRQSIEEAQLEIENVSQSMIPSDSVEPPIHEVLEKIVIYIQEQPRQEVKSYLIILFLWWLMETIASTAVSELVTPYVPKFLDESPQAAKRAVQEKAKECVGSVELLAEYRFVTSKGLVVRQNPKQSSPMVGRLSFGNTVKLLKKEKSFALITWTDESGEVKIQGWVSTHYLGKFK